MTYLLLYVILGTTCLTWAIPIHLKTLSVFANTTFDMRSFALRNLTIVLSDMIVGESRTAHQGRIESVSIGQLSTGTNDVLQVRESVIVTGNGRRRVNWYLNIGPSSFLVSRFGQVAIVRNISNPEQGELIVGDHHFSFFESCVDNSILTVPFVEPNLNQGMNGDVVEGFFRLETLDQHVIASEEYMRFRLVGGWTKLIMLPENIGSVIESLLQTTGAVRNRNMFGNCSFDRVRRELPSIILGFHGGRIELQPDDYLYFDLARSTCTPKYRIDRSQVDVVSWNPLLMKGVNIRISDSEINFCDTVLE